MQNQSRRRVAKYIAGRLAGGESPQRIAKILAAYLVMSKQTRLTDLVLRDIETEILRDHGHLVTKVISARKLSNETRAELIKMLRREVNAKTVELLETIDENLIGGIVIHTPEAELDASLKTRLTRLKAI